MLNAEIEQVKEIAREIAKEEIKLAFGDATPLAKAMAKEAAAIAVAEAKAHAEEAKAAAKEAKEIDMVPILHIDDGQVMIRAVKLMGREHIRT